MRNRNQDEYYGWGQLIRTPLTASLDADFACATTGAWTDVHNAGGTDFATASYTPPVDCWAEARLCITNRISTANSPAVFAICNSADAGLAMQYVYSAINNGYNGQTIIWDGPLTAATAYLWKVRYFIVTGGVSATVLSGDELTRLVVKVWRKP